MSTSDPGVKLHFPPDSTLQTRTVTLQVAVSLMEVCNSLSLWVCKTFDFSFGFFVGVGGVRFRGTSSVWRSSGQRQPSPLPLTDSQLGLPAAHQSSGPLAAWSHRY